MNDWSIELFFERLSSFGDRDALIWMDCRYSFKDLLQRAEQWCKILSDAGCQARDRIAIVGDFSPVTCSILLALIRGGYIAVPLSWDMYRKNENVFSVACVNLYILVEDEKHSISPRQENGDHALFSLLEQKTEPGLVLFTSGSSGKVKAALHSIKKIFNNFKEQRRGMVTLSFLLIDHIGGINTLFYLFASGGTAVCVADRQPATICQAIQKYRVQLLPTTPTFLRMLLISGAYETYDLSSLELITYGTEPMPNTTLEQLSNLLPNVRFKQTYGLTELAILPTRSRSSDSTWFSIGKGVETKIVEGRLWVRTGSAMLGYLNAESKFDEDGWYDTGDQVVVDGDFIRVLGRDSEMINVGGQKVFPEEVETVILRVSNVSEVVVMGRANPVTGQVVAARVRPIQFEPKKDLIRRIREYCLQNLDAPFKVPAVIEVSEEPLHGERFKKLRDVAI